MLEDNAIKCDDCGAPVVIEEIPKVPTPKLNKVEKKKGKIFRR